MKTSERGPFKEPRKLEHGESEAGELEEEQKYSSEIPDKYSTEGEHLPLGDCKFGGA